MVKELEWIKARMEEQGWKSKDGERARMDKEAGWIKNQDVCWNEMNGWDGQVDWDKLHGCNEREI